MANLHVLEQVGPSRFRVVLHVAIPVGNNPAGFPWRTAVAAHVVLNVSRPADPVAWIVDAALVGLAALMILSTRGRKTAQAATPSLKAQPAAGPA